VAKEKPRKKRKGTGGRVKSKRGVGKVIVREGGRTEDGVLRGRAF